MCVSNIDVPVDKLVYTHMLNSMGGIECDITIDHCAETCFIVYSSTGVHSRDMHWMAKHIKPDQHVTLTDITAAYAVLNVQDLSHGTCCSPLPMPISAIRSFRFLPLGKLTSAMRACVPSARLSLVN